MKITESQLRNIISKTIKESLENINQGQDITSIMTSLKMKPRVGRNDFSMIDPARLERHNGGCVVIFTISRKSFISKEFYNTDKAFDFATALTSNLKHAGFDLSQTKGSIKEIGVENGQIFSYQIGWWDPEYNVWYE